ncbi:MAG: histidine phosphatase family protein [Balneolaceae bacterium]|nr:histidine phosphatase family protein [Balneolaceae bacterium]
MKQILLLRHAKSSWADDSLDDFDRPLAKRGIKDAPRMGRFIRESSYKPAVIVSSPAARARQTTELLVEGAQMDQEVISWQKDLYFGSVQDYLNTVTGMTDDCERIMLVGHNPLMESFSGILAGAREQVALRMPTAALVCLESFANNWGDINAGTCQIKWMMIPKVLKKIMD